MKPLGYNKDGDVVWDAKEGPCDQCLHPDHKVICSCGRNLNTFGGEHEEKEGRFEIFRQDEEDKTLLHRIHVSKTLTDAYKNLVNDKRSLILVEVIDQSSLVVVKKKEMEQEGAVNHD